MTNDGSSAQDNSAPGTELGLAQKLEKYLLLIGAKEPPDMETLPGDIKSAFWNWLSYDGWHKKSAYKKRVLRKAWEVQAEQMRVNDAMAQTVANVTPFRKPDRRA